MTTEASETFFQRIVVGSAAVLLFLIVNYFALVPGFQWVFVVSLMLVIGISLWEYYEMAAALTFRPMVSAGIWTSCLYLIAVMISIRQPQWIILPAAVLFGFLVITCLLQLKDESNAPLANLAVTLFGFGYIVLPLSCLLYITYWPSAAGSWWLLYLVFVTKATDIGGYIVGRSFGTWPLAPMVSPKKTIEGTLGGLALAIFVSMVLSQTAPLDIHLFPALILGLVISITAQLGDLAESLLKRNAGVKDSSHLPGLGGMLDIMDSLIFTAPAMYLYLHL